MLHYSPSSLSYPIQWNIKRDPKFRLLDNIKWMENFFEKGELLISCFNNFRKYPDEMRGDKDEGKGIIGGINRNGDHTAVIYEAGLNSFIMSTTNKLTDKVKKDFNAQCAIRINNPTLFALEISKKLPFTNNGMEGKCIYVKSRAHFYEKEKRENEEFQNIDFQSDPDANYKVAQLTKGHELYLKLDKYEHQDEYRLIWFSNNILTESVIIKCPEAIEFCEKEIW